jgi:hypothetical protein
MPKNPLDTSFETIRGFLHGQQWNSNGCNEIDRNEPKDSNPLQDFFDARQEGRGIWKWLHYFDIYHRHFQKFVGRKVHVVEIGIYSGGSLDMWKNYFGEKCHLYGIDIARGCKQYEDSQTKIFIGDQGDRKFWQEFKQQVPHIDILIDDGGHQTEQQIVTLEEMLPHIRPGGVYLCEDVTGDTNGFSAYINGLAMNLNGAVPGTWKKSPNGETKAQRTPFQQEIESIHLYPFVSVIEKLRTPVDYLAAEKHGTEWKPYPE